MTARIPENVSTLLAYWSIHWLMTKPLTPAS
jgi:hypothetical protein